MQENSIATDYVTEKLYDAFVAGCVPVYYGAPNIEDLLPDPDSIIDYRRASQSILILFIGLITSELIA